MTTDWLRQRAIGKRQKMVPISTEYMRRLQLESNLKGHTGCVNCLEWNKSGNLLASGSDDRSVIIWDPFNGTKKTIVKTGHEGNIFSVKYMPETSDTLLATCAADCSVKLINLYSDEFMMNCNKCHSERVKRLAVHPNEPNLLWSAGEDGLIMQYDTREVHHCGSKPKNLLLDLKTTGSSLSAKCLAINPVRDEMVAIGSNDIHVRLFDRRYIANDAWTSCTAYLTPGHLLKSPSRKMTSHPQSHGTTYLSFSPDGSELLSNLHAEQVYLFNTYMPWERYKSFDATVKPLMQTNTPMESLESKQASLKSYSLFQDLKKCKPVELPDIYREFFDEVTRKLKSKSQSNTHKNLVTKDEIDKINLILTEIKNCVKLYHLRAAALINRGWRGDFYQAVRDCCCALALEPDSQVCIENLASASYYLGDRETAMKLLEFVKDSEISDALTALVQREDGAPLWFEWVASNTRNDLTQHDELIVDDVTGDLMITFSSFEQQQYLSQFLHNSNTQDNRQYVRDISITVAEQLQRECQRSMAAFDFSKRFCGHCNLNTDIKEANFFGQDGEFIVAGSDDGAFYIWSKETTNIVKAVYGDLQTLNCLQPHPSICMLATSGVEPAVKLWSPGGKVCQDVKSLEVRCAQNQECILSDPLEAMIMMLYSNRDI